MFRTLLSSPSTVVYMLPSVPISSTSCISRSSSFAVSDLSTSRRKSSFETVRSVYVVPFGGMAPPPFTWIMTRQSGTRRDVTGQRPSKTAQSCLVPSQAESSLSRTAPNFSPEKKTDRRKLVQSRRACGDRGCYYKSAVQSYRTPRTQSSSPPVVHEQ